MHAWVKKGVVASGAAFVLSGCAPVASSYRATETLQSGKAPVGPVYKLPNRTIAVTIGSDENGVFVAMHSLQYEGDPTADYVLHYNYDISSADKLTIEVDPTTNLLRTAAADADSKADDSIVNLVKSAAKIQGFELGNANGTKHAYVTRTLNYWGRANMDKKEADDALDQFNQTLNKELKKVVWEQGCVLKNTQVLSPEQQTILCADGARVPSPWPFGDVAINIDYTPYRGSTDVDRNACRIGLCTRVENPANIELSTIGFVDTARISLPNGSSPVPLPLRRHPFTTAKTDYTLANGIFSKVTLENGAALPSIAALPGKLLAVAVDAMIEGIDLRKKLQAKTETKTNGGQNEIADNAKNPDTNLLAIVYPLPQLPQQNAEGAAKPASESAMQKAKQNNDCSQTPAYLGRTTNPGPQANCD